MTSLQPSPDLAVLTATLGLGLIFLECNRPGRILPGASGLLLTLLATARLLHVGIRPWAAALLFAVVGTFLVNLRTALPTTLLGAASLTAVLALRFLVPPGNASPVPLWLAIVCAGLLCPSAAILTRIAHRAHRAKNGKLGADRRFGVRFP